MGLFPTIIIVFLVKNSLSLSLKAGRSHAQNKE
jgi:hypothetical protein